MITRTGQGIILSIFIGFVLGFIGVAVGAHPVLTILVAFGTTFLSLPGTILMCRSIK